jgi:hypothetical protein
MLQITPPSPLSLLLFHHLKKGKIRIFILTNHNNTGIQTLWSGLV